MSLNQEYRLLLCWAKEKILDNMNVPGWSTPVLTDTHKALPKILNPVENLRDGRLFMMMLNKINPDIFILPDEDTDVKYHLMYTLRKFFGDLNFESGDLFGRLKSSFEQESTKWEIMEIVFLVAFICQPGYCECGEKISHFYGLLDMDDSLPIVIKMVLRILMRSIEKMDLKGLVNDLTPFRPMKKRFQVSTGTKRKRQEELLSELEQEKTENKKMRKRLKELEIEISELLKQKSIITLMDNDIGNNNYNSELQHLKERLENEQENRETKNRKITELNQEISRLNDDLDLVNCKLNEYKMRETRYLSYNKKFEKINKMEAVIKELTEQYNQSAEDKNVLLSEIQRLRINSRTSECLSKEINDVNDRYLKALGEINDLNRHNENLRNLLGQRTEKIKILENELNLLRNKLETPLASQRNSLGTEVPSLWVEEYEVKLKELQTENSQLKLSLSTSIEYTSLENFTAQISSINTVKDDLFLKYANLQSKYHLLEYNSDQNQEKLLQEIADIKNESKILDTKLKHQTALNEELDAKLNNCKICLELKEDNLRLEEINKKLNSRIESRTLMIEQEQKRLKELRILYEKGIKELNDLKEEHIRLREKFQEECKINDHN